MISLLISIFVNRYKLLTLPEDEYQIKVACLNELNFLLSKKYNQPQLAWNNLSRNWYDNNSRGIHYIVSK